MATIYVNELVKLFKKALDEKWGYIYGAAGDKWTQAKQDAATRELTVKYGQQWVGRRVADCSGLFYWAFKELGGYMYHGSNTMWSRYCTSKGALKSGKRSDGDALKPGSAVFKLRNSTDYYHVGLYVGDDIVIEAKSTAKGVVTSKVNTWTHWGELKGVSYADVDVTNNNNISTVYTTLGQRILKYTSPTMKGEDVKILQTKLNALGYSCGSVDGYFGKNTNNALMLFQKDRGLTVDGICGSKTIEALNTKYNVESPTEQTTYTVVSGDTLGKIAQKLLGRSSRYIEIMKANNMTSVRIYPGDVLIIPKA